MNLRKALGPLLAALLLAGVVVAINYSMKGQKDAQHAAGRITVKILTGSDLQRLNL